MENICQDEIPVLEGATRQRVLMERRCRYNFLPRPMLGQARHPAQPIQNPATAADKGRTSTAEAGD